jgi:outer membrane protein OmpA-like peptidoglycan-associated protein
MIRTLSLTLVATALALPACAQNATPDSAPVSPQTQQQDTQTQQQNATNKAPLQTKSQEGFWGHLNPFARKKWVHRQTDPINDRLTEVDQLSKQNGRDIQDLDKRSTAGINEANSAANAADQKATDAGNRANQANGMAQRAGTRTDATANTVNGLDQYTLVSNATIKFPAGRTTLTPAAKKSLDDVAAKLDGRKGYIVEVSGHSRSGLQTSDATAAAVTRYLVTAHQIPLYRIHKVALGNAKTADAKVKGTYVDVTLLENSLANQDLSNSTQSMTGAPDGTTQLPTTQHPSPVVGVASSPTP